MQTETQNRIHFDKAKLVKSKQEAWTNDLYFEVPFSCEASITCSELHDRLKSAFYDHFYKMWPSYDFVDVRRNSDTSGVFTYRQVYMIGD